MCRAPLANFLAVGLSKPACGVRRVWPISGPKSDIIFRPKYFFVIFGKKQKNWKTSVLGISNIKVWGEGGHKVGKNGKKWIFLLEFCKKKIRKTKFYTTKMPKFGSNLAKFGPKWFIFEFLTKKRNRNFFDSRKEIPMHSLRKKSGKPQF